MACEAARRGRRRGGGARMRRARRRVAPLRRGGSASGRAASRARSTHARSDAGARAVDMGANCASRLACRKRAHARARAHADAICLPARKQFRCSRRGTHLQLGDRERRRVCLERNLKRRRVAHAHIQLEEHGANREDGALGYTCTLERTPCGKKKTTTRLNEQREKNPPPPGDAGRRRRRRLAAAPAAGSASAASSVCHTC